MLLSIKVDNSVLHVSTPTCASGFMNTDTSNVSKNTTLFSVLTMENKFIQIDDSTQNSKKCKGLIARRISNELYIFMQTCDFLVNDINVFKLDDSRLSIFTSQGSELFLRFVKSADSCSKPKLIFATETTPNTVAVLDTKFSIYVPPAPIVPPVSSETQGVSTGIIVAIVIVAIIIVGCLIYFLSKPKKNATPRWKQNLNASKAKVVTLRPSTSTKIDQGVAKLFASKNKT